MRSKLIKIAICDDEQNFIDELKGKIYKTEDIIGEEIDIKPFLTGESLCRELSNGKGYNIIFLDIMMTGLDGIDVGNFIRNKLEDNNTQIIYVSSESRYAMKLFKLQPMEFLIKPVKDKDIIDVMKKAYSYINNGKRIFSFNNKGDIYRIPICEILYFEVIKRKMYLHTEKEIFEFYGGIEEVYNKLSSDNFVFIHRSYLVNINQVRSFKNNILVLVNGEELPISRNRKGEIREKCLSMLF